MYLAVAQIRPRLVRRRRRVSGLGDGWLSTLWTNLWHPQSTPPANSPLVAELQAAQTSVPKWWSINQPESISASVADTASAAVDVVRNALPTWIGGTSGALTSGQIGNQIADCQAQIWAQKARMIASGYQNIPPDAYFQANADKCSGDIQGLANQGLPVVDSPTSKWLLIAGVAVAAIFVATS